MHSFSKALLVYDGTDEAQAALTRCSQLSLAFSAAVDVVSIVDMDSANACGGGLLTDLAYVHLDDLARRTLDQAIARLAADGVAAHGYVRFGCVTDVVLCHAQAFQPDVVVVGLRSRKKRSWWRNDAPRHLDLAERLAGTTIVTVTLPPR
jgi:nucleotide-binding universal stress UspA family protein